MAIRSLERFAGFLWSAAEIIRLEKPLRRTWALGYAAVRACPWCHAASFDHGGFCPQCGKPLLVRQFDPESKRRWDDKLERSRCAHCGDLAVGGASLPTLDGSSVHLAHISHCPSCSKPLNIN